MPLQKTKREVSQEAQAELETVLYGVRDSALDAVGQAGSENWQAIMIEWRTSNTKARLSNLGKGCIDLILYTETHSSNGVRSFSDFEVKLRSDEPSQACESWNSDWSHPSPGSSFGHRDGDEAVGQLEVELSRSIEPISASTVHVTLV